MSHEKVTVGDWSCDGHNQSDDYMINVPEGINSATCEKAAHKLFGFAMDDYCNDYEDCQFPTKHIHAIISNARLHGFEPEFPEYAEMAEALREVSIDDMLDPNYSDDYAEDGQYNLGSGDYVGLWLAYVNVGLRARYGADAQIIRLIKESPGKVHHIGGYGLFFS